DVARHPCDLVAQLHAPAHVLAIAADAKASHGVPRAVDDAAVQHAFQGVAATLIGAVGQTPQALALADRITGHALAAKPVVLTDHPAAEVDADVAVTAAREVAVIAQVLRPAAGL